MTRSARRLLAAHLLPLLLASCDDGGATAYDPATGLTWRRHAAPNEMQQPEADAYCDALVSGGQSDFRLPTVHDLLSLIDFDRMDPALDGRTIAPTIEIFWSATPEANDPNRAWLVGFWDGSDFSSRKTGVATERPVLCVRGPPIAMHSFTVNLDGTATDTRTGAIWQRSADANPHGFVEAESLCANLDLGGVPVGSFRLPTIEELLTLVRYDLRTPAIDPTVFSGTASISYWSDTPYPGVPDGQHRTVNFDSGSLSSSDPYAPNRVRCVR